MNKQFYLISDLHIGGENSLNNTEFEPELIAFLKQLSKQENAELIIAGDAFGFWELGEMETYKKLKTIINNHPSLFAQFKTTGANVPISVLPGNHDQELIEFSEISKLLEKYNIQAIKSDHLIKEIDGKQLWIEHGSQSHIFNKVENFYSTEEKSAGYYISQAFLALLRKGHLKYPWLRDLESVQPQERLLEWFLSSFFYFELHPFTKWIVLPTLIVISLPTYVLWKVFAFLAIRNFSRFISELEIFPSKKALKIHQNEVYIQSAKQVFAKNNRCIAFFFGHTHSPMIENFEGKHIVNTGTWLKSVVRFPSRIPFLPPVYLPQFRLNYFKIYQKGRSIIMDYRVISKKTKFKLTPLQKFALLGKIRRKQLRLPPRVVLFKAD